MQSNTSEIMKRLGLAVIGQALPKTSALCEIINDLRLGLLATVITGVLVSSLVLLGCLLFYQFLITEGLTNHAAIGLSAGVLLLLSIISGLLAEKYISRTQKAKKKLAPLTSDDTEANNVDSLFKAFIEGLCEEEAGSQKQPSNEYQKHNVPSPPNNMEKQTDDAHR